MKSLFRMPLLGKRAKLAGIAALAIGLSGGLSGCVAYPTSGYGYGTGYDYGGYSGYYGAPVYAPPVYVAPPVVSGSFIFGGGWGGGWDHDRGGWGGGWDHDRGGWGGRGGWRH